MCNICAFLCQLPCDFLLNINYTYVAIIAFIVLSPDDSDLQPVLRILHTVKHRATQIGEELRVHSQIITQIQQIAYRNNSNLWHIAIIVAWLKGNYDKNGHPYTLHDKKHQHPSWWNLLYAVARRTGGNDYALAEKIAKNKG